MTDTKSLADTDLRYISVPIRYQYYNPACDRYVHACEASFLRGDHKLYWEDSHVNHDNRKIKLALTIPAQEYPFSM